MFTKRSGAVYHHLLINPFFLLLVFKYKEKFAQCFLLDGPIARFGHQAFSPPSTPISFPSYPLFLFLFIYHLLKKRNNK